LRFLLIDKREWEHDSPKGGSRVRVVCEAIEKAVAAVTVEPRPQVYPNGARALDWELRAAENARDFQGIVIHCSDGQTDCGNFLKACCEEKPVLGYAAGRRESDVRQFFKDNKQAAFLPLAGISPTPTQVEEIARWIGSIVYANGDLDAIKKACNILNGFDEELEQQLMTLKGKLIERADLAELKKLRDRYSKLGFSC
jgi:hypothetical protein